MVPAVLSVNLAQVVLDQAMLANYVVVTMRILAYKNN